METSLPPKTWAEATDVLRATLPNYEERPQQTRLALAIEDAWASDRPLIGQAGTGTGKSLAALIPAILSGRRTLYSTGTKALQAQVMNKDLPFLAANLGVNFRYAMLQGRSNYVCHTELFASAEPSAEVTAIREVISTEDQAWADDQNVVPVTHLRESLPFEVSDETWKQVSISSERCTRKECPFFDNGCRFEQSRRLADNAHVVVVNHALVAQDAVLYERTDGNVSLLGDIHNVVIDEAHELEQYLIGALEDSITVGTFRALTAVLRTTAAQLDQDDIDDLLIDLVSTAEHMWTILPVDGRIRHLAIIEALDEIEPVLKALRALQDVFADVDADLIENRQKLARLRTAQKRIANLLRALTTFVLARDSQVVRYVKVERDAKVLYVTPIEIGEWAAENMWSRYTPVLTSATVLVDGSSAFIAHALGVNDPTTLDVGSPFDFANQARLYVPDLPYPVGKDRPRWAEGMYNEIQTMVQASEGRALLLFTSLSQMKDAFFNLRTRLGYPVKMQGDMPNAKLTAWLRDTGGVLFATKSFFTGIDIQGDNLSLVVVDKLPFPVPTDPIFEARTELCEARGGNPFSELTIPEMTLPLMQAFGRLIRTMTDSGVVAIMDGRITGKGYGRKVSRSIPAPLITDLSKVVEFFENRPGR